jgi:hypothetical protein
MPAKLNVGDFCKKGHKIEDGNVRYYKNSNGNHAVGCLECSRSYEREKARKRRSNYGQREMIEANSRRYRDKTRAERYDKILAVELSEGTGKYTGLNYLKLNKRSQRAWEPLEKKFDQTKSNCYDDPERYIDYDENNPPLASRAYAMCKGCPMLVECARFAAAYKPPIGVWGGEVYIDGKVVR